MGRLIRVTIVFLLLGAIVNVLVAWTCVAVSKQRMFNAQRLGQLRAAKYAEEERRALADAMTIDDSYVAMLFESPGTRLLVMGNLHPGLRGARTLQQMGGWPMLSLLAEQSPAFGTSAQVRWGMRMGILELNFPSLPDTTSAPGATSMIPGPTSTAPVTATRPATVFPCQFAMHLLPLRPIWPGFAINTIVCALGSWILWLTLLLAVRVPRRWRGQCGYCGYPTGVSPVCTECGRPVKARQRGASPAAKLLT